MFTMESQFIHNKVFKMLTIDEINIKAHGSNEQDDDNTDASSEGYRRFQYVQIRKQTDANDRDGHQQIQIIDISAHVKYDLAKIDNDLLTMINAVVSHELRNPLNSIIH